MHHQSKAMANHLHNTYWEPGFHLSPLQKISLVTGVDSYSEMMEHKTSCSSRPWGPRKKPVSLAQSQQRRGGISMLLQSSRDRCRNLLKQLSKFRYQVFLLVPWLPFRSSKSSEKTILIPKIQIPPNSGTGGLCKERKVGI